MEIETLINQYINGEVNYFELHRHLEENCKQEKLETWRKYLTLLDGNPSVSDSKKMLMYSAILCVASSTNRSHYLNLALQYGADINAKNHYFQLTALEIVVTNGHVDCLKLLLDQGAAVNTQNNEGMTALMYAAAHSQVDCIKLLLSKGAALNAKDKNGKTALMYAASKGHINCIEVLLNQGAAIDMQDHKGNTALMHTILNDLYYLSNSSKGEKHTKCLAYLLEKEANVNIKNNDGNSALMYAVICNNTMFAKTLLEHAKNIEINACNNKGLTALSLTASQLYINAPYLDWLLEKGADVNLKNNEEETALMVHLLRVINSNPKKIDACFVKSVRSLSSEININTQNKNGVTALMLAATFDAPVFLKILLEKEADMNIQDANGMTAVMYTIKAGKLRCFKCLIAQGARLDLKNKDDKTALELAQQLGLTNFIDHIQTRTNDIILDSSLGKRSHSSSSASFFSQPSKKPSLTFTEDDLINNNGFNHNDDSSERYESDLDDASMDYEDDSDNTPTMP